jgi:hypothetical protein
MLNTRVVLSLINMSQQGSASKIGGRPANAGLPTLISPLLSEKSDYLSPGFNIVAHLFTSSYTRVVLSLINMSQQGSASKIGGRPANAGLPTLISPLLSEKSDYLSPGFNIVASDLTPDIGCSPPQAYANSVS